MGKPAVLLLMVACLIAGCYANTTRPTTSWINGEWKYNAPESMLLQAGGPVDEAVMQKLLETCADNENDRLIIADNRKTFKYLSIEIDLVEEERSADSITYRGTGENKIGTLHVRKISNNRIEIILSAEMPGGLSTSSLGIFDKAR